MHPRKSETVHNSDWWKSGVIYQIYVRSFYDSSGDGIGDIRGIINKIDYLKDLGIDAVWLSPVNRSPMYDMGYDVSDYRAIDPIFGTDRDFESLIKKLHAKDIKIIMDLVINHTSHLHPWFLASRSSKKNAKRDWYIWRKPAPGGGPPNNWKSAFGGSAWEMDAHTGQYYLHSCLKEQPDLNWRCSELKSAVFAEIRYWLDRGIDGFRLDVVNWFVKDKYFRDNPFSFNPVTTQKHKYDRNRPETHDILREIRKILDEYPGRMSVGEVFTLPPGDPELSASYLGNGKDELHMAFDFSLIYRLWSAGRFRRAVNKWYKSIPPDGWPCIVLSNHDQARGISRYGMGETAEKKARVAAVMQLTLRGTPFIYYGEEIGMRSRIINRKDIVDPLGKKYWPFFPGRDPARTPMQWTRGPNAGFTAGKVWLPVCDDYPAVNVENQADDRYSLLCLYKDLIRIRKGKKALYEGEYKPVLIGLPGIYAYYRIHGKEKIFVALNFTGKRKKIYQRDRGQWSVLFSTHRHKRSFETDLSFQLMPYEASVFEFKGDLK
jgi:alpha-glucosidase